LRVSVTRDDKSLTIAQVPSLTEGDRISINADLPDDQDARFLMLSAFLRGATNPPPKKWIHTVETWKPMAKDSQLSLVIPKGARQLVLFLVPATGGAASAISEAVRNRPGQFVRATQELNQASLDRSRLDTFLTGISAQATAHPEYLRTVAPRLARSLSIKLNEDCLSRVIDMQASCLVENRDTLVMGDMHSSSVAETIAGTPTDLAMQLSSTREAGQGYYSAYIGVVRDIARIFGAFGNPDLDYLPTLSTREGDAMSLILNRAPSFGKPRSVLVAALPGIEGDSPPRLRPAVTTALCAARPDFALPVEGAPLIYSTAYAHDMTVILTPANGSPVTVPVKAQADRGGYIFTDALPAGLTGSISAKLQGYWGFRPFEGPAFTLQVPEPGTLHIADDSPALAPGSEQILRLSGASPACIDSITADRVQPRGKPKRLAWTVDGDQDIQISLPLKDAKPGVVTLQIRYFGMADPVAMPVTVAEPEPQPVVPPTPLPTSSPMSPPVVSAVPTRR
jgi:hypothetical protein